MSITIHLAYAGWFLMALALFAFKPARQAVIYTFVLGFLFMPNAGYDLPLLHTKLEILSIGVLLCTFIFDRKRWLQFRLRLIDLPMLVWCLSPFASTVANGLEISFYVLTEHIVTWGIPYFIGRAYITDLEGLRDLAVGILTGALLYVPLCWWELRMSPHLHYLLYGFHSHDFLQATRYGGYRPTVFLQHGLAVAIWMGFASILGFWLWRSGTLKRLWGIPIVWFLPPLFLTTLLCRCVNAYVLLLIGCVVYFVMRNLLTAIPIYCLLAASPVYMVLRTTGSWSGESLVDYTEQMVNPERALSLKVRIDNETMLLERAVQQKVFGWSQWGRSRIRNAQGSDISITDGIWVIIFGVSGLVGLISWMMTILLPAVVLLWRWPARLWTHRNTGVAGAFAVLLCLHMMDNLFNALVTPILTLAAGAVLALRKKSIAPALRPKLVTPPYPISLRPTVRAQFANRRA